MKIGYACINLSLDCSCSRTFRLGSFSREKFLAAAKNNLACLEQIIRWNKSRGIYFFRLSSGLIPWADHPVCRVNWQKIFKDDFCRLGFLIRENKTRISMHPDHFTVLNSPRRRVLEKSIASLKYHNDVLDLLGLDSSNKIQIHLGGAYDDKEKSKARFAVNYKKLPIGIRKRLVLENDDRIFSLQDCLGVSVKAGLPVVFDAFHHKLLNNGESWREAAGLASKTWKKSEGPLMVDFSSQAKNKRRGAHADYIDKKTFEKFLRETSGVKKDIMLEAKKKDLAFLKLF